MQKISSKQTVTITKVSAADIRQDEAEHNLLRRLIRRLKQKSSLMNHAFSIRMLIFGLTLVFTAAILVVAISAATNISRLLTMASDAQDSNLSLMYTLVKEQFLVPEAVADQMVSTYESGLVPNGRGKYMLLHSIRS
jgi:hypothetical protein